MPLPQDVSSMNPEKCWRVCPLMLSLLHLRDYLELLWPLWEISQSTARCLIVSLLFIFVFWFLKDLLGFPMLDHEYRHFVSLLDSESYLMSPAGTMQKTNLRWSLTAIPGQQHKRNFPSCKEIFSHAWSDVAFDHRPTHRQNRALHRLCQTTGRQACHRVFAPSRRDQDRERLPVLPHLVALLHWLQSPWWCSWIFEASPFWQNSNHFCSACMLKLPNLPRIFFPLTFSKRVPAFIWRVKRSLILMFWACRHFSPSFMLLWGRIVLVASFPEVSCPQILAHTDCDLEVRTFAKFLWTLSFPNFYVVPCAIWECDGVIWSHPIEETPSVKQLIRFHPFLRLLKRGCPSPSVCLNWHWSPNLHPHSRLVIFDMREDANNHTTDPSSFLWGNLCTLSGFLIQKDFVPWAPKPSEGLLPSICVCACGLREDDCAFCPRSLPWLKLQEPRLDDCQVAFHW